MQNSYSISVVIPTYNRGDMLLRAVQSALDQTYPVSEIFVCDDGSTDNSKQIISSLAHPKVTWIECGRNGRPAIPRNIGIVNSTSDWIAFLDSDDEWLPNKIEEQIALVLKTQCKAVCSNAFRIIANLNKTNYLTFNNSTISFEDLLSTNYVICSSMMLHRSVFDTLKGFPEGIEFKAIEDYCLWLKVAMLSPIAYVNNPLVNYLDDPHQSIRANDKSVNLQRKIIFQELISWLNKTSIENKVFYIRKVKFELKSSETNPRKKVLLKIKNLVKQFLRK